MSAHDTTPGHAASTFVLMVSMTSKPRTELALGPAPFSPVKLDVSSRRMEPSQPWQAFHKHRAAKRQHAHVRFGSVAHSSPAKTAAVAL